MSSLELFTRNVRALLEKRSWRICDLADRTGISGAYLSQVLNGNKKNISDIGSCGFAGPETPGPGSIVKSTGAIESVCISEGNTFQALDLRYALKWYEQGLSCTEDRCQPRASLLVNIIGVLLQMKRTSAAEQYLEDLQDLVTQNETLSGVEHYRQRCAEMRGIICMQMHDWAGARGAFEQVIAQSQGKWAGHVGVAWHSLGLLNYYEDKCEESRNCFTSAEQCFLALGLERQLEALYVDLAKVALRQGCFEEAEELLTRAEKCPHEQPWILLLRACVEKCRGHTTKALALARAAIDGFRSRDFENELACAALWLSKVLTENGELLDARFSRTGPSASIARSDGMSSTCTT
ncbi:MAG: hypothetical protein ACOX4B_02600 [Bacillota bacterium]|jgi:tetratricopeptide (TPR) repeat protein